MREVYLSRDKVMLIDNEDTELIDRFSWSWFKSRHTFYATADLGGRDRVLAHRLILGAQPHELVDHKDSNGLNNCRNNLRICNRFQNGQHARNRKDNTTGYRGVSKLKKGFVARIRVCGERLYLGYFNSPIVAAQAYDKMALKCHGEFAQLNFKEGKQ